MNPTNEFFTNEEEFNKFLGMTDHYKSLQDKVVRLVNPKSGQVIIEVGCGTGSTAITLAKKCSEAQIIAVDNRVEVIKEAERIAKREGVKNIDFVELDMADIGNFIRKHNINPNTMLFLYSFHHIPDPISNKIKVAKDIFDSCPNGTKVIIGDGLVPVSHTNKKYSQEVFKQEKPRPHQTYLSVFWEQYIKNLESGIADEDCIKDAVNIAKESEEMERSFADMIANRDGEFLLSLDEFKKVWTDAGFNIQVCEAINSLGETIAICIKE